MSMTTQNSHYSMHTLNISCSYRSSYMHTNIYLHSQITHTVHSATTKAQHGPFYSDLWVEFHPGNRNRGLTSFSWNLNQSWWKAAEHQLNLKFSCYREHSLPVRVFFLCIGIRLYNLVDTYCVSPNIFFFLCAKNKYTIYMNVNGAAMDDQKKRKNKTKGHLEENYRNLNKSEIVSNSQRSTSHYFTWATTPTFLFYLFTI